MFKTFGDIKKLYPKKVTIRFDGEMSGNPIMAVLKFESHNDVFICSNDPEYNGAPTRNKFGYKYSYILHDNNFIESCCPNLQILDGKFAIPLIPIE